MANREKADMIREAMQDDLFTRAVSAPVMRNITMLCVLAMDIAETVFCGFTSFVSDCREIHRFQKDPDETVYAECAGYAVPKGARR